MLSFILTNATSHPPTYTVGYPSRESVSPFIPLVASTYGRAGSWPRIAHRKTPTAGFQVAVMESNKRMLDATETHA